MRRVPGWRGDIVAAGTERLARTVSRESHAAPEVLAVAALLAVGAGWATSVGTLPGRLPPGPGVAGMALAWVGLFGVLGGAYRAAGSREKGPTRRLRRRLGLGLLLALVSTHLCRLLAASLVTPFTWDHLFYVKWLVPMALVTFWCAVLLSSETRALVRATRSSAAFAPVPHLAVLFVSAAILVSLTDLAFEWSGESVAGSTLRSEIISGEAWTANVLMLFGGFGLVLALTRRVWVALLVVSPLYAALTLGTLIKIRYMHSAVQPLDLLRLPELLPFLRTFWGTGALAAGAGALGLWVGALALARRTEPCPVSLARRWSTGMLALGLVLAFPVAYFRSTTIPDDVEGSLPRADALLSRFGIRGREFKEMARLRGPLISFVSEVPAAFAAAPPGYSQASVARTASKYCHSDAGAEPRRGGVNLILYLVESLMDPEDLGLHYTADPIPNLRALRRSHVGGYGIVPEEFGGSATTEFETLSGMAASFLPEGSVAYRLYLRRPIPSLPSALRSLGYATTAIQADPKHYYDRERAYRLLGFDKVVWLGDDPDIEREPRGWWPADRTVVEAVVRASRASQPFFVFAFPSSTHFPYNSGSYRDSRLDVLDVPSKDVHDEVKEYINTLRVADREIGKLVEYFRARPDSTIIAVLGDHLPPLPERALRTFFARLSGTSEFERARWRRRVPLLVWANFDLPREETDLSTHALPAYLLEKMGIEPAGFLAVSDAVRRRVPVLTSYAQAADGTRWHRDSLPALERHLLDDYRLLQYDLLLGERYSMSGPAPRESSCGELLQAREVSSP